MNANLVQVDGVNLAPHAAGMTPADQRAESGITLSAFDATVESGGTTTSCILSATGLPAGFNPGNPPRALKWLDGDAAGETGLVVSWVAGTRTLTYTAIGTPPSNGSHVRFGPPQQIDGLGSVASVGAPVSVGGGTITSVTDPVTVGTITDKTGYTLAAAGLDQVVVETGINARQALAPILAATAGKSTHPSSTQILFAAGKTTAGGSPPTRVTATVDGTGERTDVTLSVPP
jgi:hypothetical protein